MAYDYELVKVDVSDGVAVFQLNRPPLNPLNTQLFTEIGQCSLELTYDDAVRAVVLTGGPEVFAAGADIKDMVDMSLIMFSRFIKGAQDSFSAVENIPKPIIAAINGFALGGGCEQAA